eukprot:1144074-Amorphochlora_amoeboformis.AAC.2
MSTFSFRPSRSQRSRTRSENSRGDISQVRSSSSREDSGIFFHEKIDLRHMVLRKNNQPYSMGLSKREGIAGAYVGWGLNFLIFQEGKERSPKLGSRHHMNQGGW